MMRKILLFALVVIKAFAGAGEYTCGGHASNCEKCNWEGHCTECGPGYVLEDHDCQTNAWYYGKYVVLLIIFLLIICIKKCKEWCDKK